MSQIHLLQNLFENDITVLSIAEQLTIQSTDSFREYANTHGFDSVLLRTKGKELLVFDKGDEFPKQLKHNEIIADSTPLIDVFDLLMNLGRLYVKVKSEITHIVTLSDLDKIPMRIWMFGVISICEQELKEEIRRYGIRWETSIPPDRLQHAQDLYQMKIAQNEQIDLLQCLQISDLNGIILDHDHLKNKYAGDYSNRKFRSLFSRMTKLRNELAHGQQLTSKWLEIWETMKFAYSTAVK